MLEVQGQELLDGRLVFDHEDIGGHRRPFYGARMTVLLPFGGGLPAAAAPIHALC
jgi:hypothetical protein